MRYKLTLVLIVLNILIYYLIVNLDRRSIVGAEHAGNIFGLFSSEVAIIERLEIGGELVGETRVLEREDQAWVITEPIYWPANYFAVQRILTQLQFLKAEAHFSVDEIEQSGQTLADYGLDKPSLEFAFGIAGDETRIKVGVPTEFGGRLYILGANGEDVYVVNRTFLESLVVDLEDLRDAEVFNIPLFEVSALTIQQSGRSKTKVRLVRTDNDWKFEAPLQIMADNRRVDSVLAQLESLTALKFIRSEGDDFSLYGLVDPSMKITLQGNNRRQSLLIGDRIENHEGGNYYYARLESIPTVFTLDATTIDPFKNAQEMLRSRKVFTANLSDATSLRIQQSGHVLTLDRLEDGKWQGSSEVGAGDATEFLADSKTVEHCIDILSHLEVVRFVSDAPSEADLDKYGFTSPQRVIKIKGAVEQTLLLGDVDLNNKLLYAKRGTMPYIYEVPLYLLDDFPLDFLFYKNRLIEELPASSQIVSLVLRDQEKSKDIVQLKANEDESLDALIAKLPEHEAGALAGITQSIHRLEAHSFLKLAFDPLGYQMDASTMLPWRYVLDVQVVRSGDKAATDLRYYFTERLGGTLQIGGSPQSDVVFTLQQPLVDALNSLTNKIIKPDIENK